MRKGMVKIRFNPVEVAYKTFDGKPVVELYGKAGDGTQVCVQVRGFEPYFWAMGSGIATDEKIARIEEHSKKFLGKEIVARKIFVKQPSDVPAIRGKFNSLEADIPFTRRYLIDNKITPLMTYEAEGEFVEGNYKVSVFAA